MFYTKTIIEISPRCRMIQILLSDLFHHMKETEPIKLFHQKFKQMTKSPLMYPGSLKVLDDPGYPSIYNCLIAAILMIIPTVSINKKITGYLELRVYIILPGRGSFHTKRRRFYKLHTGLYSRLGF